MPAWITSLLRDDVTVPMPSAASRTITSRPACASRRAIARPITPAPITTHSTLSIRSSDPEIAGGPARRALRWDAPVENQLRALTNALVEGPLFVQPVGFV